MGSKGVLIVGAGISGLTLANVLRVNKIPYKIVEKQSQNDWKANQIKISKNNYPEQLNQTAIKGLKSILSTPLFNDLQQYSFPSAPSVNFLDESGKILAELENDSEKYLQTKITYENLLKVLTNNIKISFDQELVNYSKKPPTAPTDPEKDNLLAEFANSTASEHNLIVMCDGRRSLMSKFFHNNSVPVDLGYRIIQGVLPYNEQQCELIKHLLRDRTFFLGSGDALQFFKVQFPPTKAKHFHQSGPVLFWNYSWHATKVKIHLQNQPTVQELKQISLDRTKQFLGGKLSELIAQTSESNLSIEKVNCLWFNQLHEVPIIGIGESSIILTQFRKESASVAVLHALELGKRLKNYPSNDSMVPFTKEFNGEILNYYGPKYVHLATDCCISLHVSSYFSKLVLKKALSHCYYNMDIYKPLDLQK